MSDVLWGVFFMAVGAGMFVGGGGVLREMQRRYDRSHFGWRPPLWVWSVVWWFACAAAIGLGIGWIVDAVTG